MGKNEKSGKSARRVKGRCLGKRIFGGNRFGWGLKGKPPGPRGPDPVILRPAGGRRTGLRAKHFGAGGRMCSPPGAAELPPGLINLKGGFFLPAPVVKDV